VFLRPKRVIIRIRIGGNGKLDSYRVRHFRKSLFPPKLPGLYPIGRNSFAVMLVDGNIPGIAMLPLLFSFFAATLTVLAKEKGAEYDWYGNRTCPLFSDNYSAPK